VCVASLGDILCIFLVAAALFMLYLGQNSAWLSAVSTNKDFESTNYKTENTVAGHNFYSTDAKCDSIPKPPYPSEIVTYKATKRPYFIETSSRFIFRSKIMWFNLHLQLP
jgi:hypothetical protein